MRTVINPTPLSDHGRNRGAVTDLFHSCALAAFVDCLPLDDTHAERSKRLAYQYYEEELKIRNASSGERATPASPPCDNTNEIN